MPRCSAASTRSSSPAASASAAPCLRAASCDGLGVLGLALDEEANAAGPAERRISPPESRAEVWVVPTDEEREIARCALAVLEDPAHRDPARS